MKSEKSEKKSMKKERREREEGKKRSRDKERPDEKLLRPEKIQSSKTVKFFRCFFLGNNLSEPRFRKAT